ncbi:MAG: hypothetical protein NZT61_07685 [Deltaproteobacteria bacterium]|nr:hypothetical protein [Deltaproteobacteria bacterium]
MITSEGGKPRILRENFKGSFLDFYFVNPHGTSIEILGIRKQFAEGTLLVKTVTVPNDVNLQFTDIQNIHDFFPLRRRPSKNFMEWIQIESHHEVLYLHTTEGKLYTLDEIRQKARKTTRVAESIKSYELKIKFSTLAKEPKLSPRDIFQPTEAEFRQHPELLLDFCLVNSLTVFRSTSCPTIVTSPQDEVYMLLQTHQADSSEYFIVNFNNKNVGGSLRGNLQKNRLYKVNHLEASVEFEEMVGEKKAFLQIRLEGSDGVNRAVRVPVEIMGKTKAPYRVTILAEAVVVSSISDLSLEVWVSNHGVGRKNLGYPYADFIPIQLIKKEDKSYLLGVLLGNKTCLVCLEIEQQN